MQSNRVTALAVCCVLLQACTNIGPGTVKRDRFDYNTAISDSWKQQTLLNIVKLRYADMPVFVEVVSVVSGYQLEGSLSAGGQNASSGAVQGDFLTFGTTGRYIDRPTITYQPITGSHFNESFMTPIPPRAILFLMQMGWPADLVLPLTVDSINGLRSRIAAGANQRAGDRGYYQIVRLLRDIQKSGAVGMQIRKYESESEATVLFFYRDTLAPEMHARVDEFHRLLDLDPETPEYNVIYGGVPRNRSEIALGTLSMLQIIIKLASMVDVPPEDIASGSTIPTAAGGGPDGARDLIRIRQGIDRPESAFVSIRYRDRWFWIDDGDFASKRTFTFLMVLFSLTETGGREGLPLVTIPAN
jgi:hypothetical protein